MVTKIWVTEHPMIRLLPFVVHTMLLRRARPIPASHRPCPMHLQTIRYLATVRHISLIRIVQSTNTGTHTLCIMARIATGNGTHHLMATQALLPSMVLHTLQLMAHRLLLLHRRLHHPKCPMSTIVTQWKTRRSH